MRYSLLMRNSLLLSTVLCLLAACAGGNSQETSPKIKEDAKAKQMLQGIWLNDDAGDVAFKVKGDTIFYPDTTSMPVRFCVLADTLVLNGARSSKYPILKQTDHVFVFANQNGEQIKLVKSEDAYDNVYFEDKKVRPLNQNQLIKRDTVVAYTANKYHCYVQVNPTTYKVVKSSYNDEGVAVDNIYHDNIVHLSIFQGTAKIFSSDFKKAQFAHCVPSEILDEAILSDLLFTKIDSEGIHYVAVLGIGDSNISYDVDVVIGFNGKLTLKTDK